MTKVALTGATGFVGSNLISHLKHVDLITIGRSKPAGLKPDNFYEASLDPNTDFTKALVEVDVVIHCAAIAHVMQDAAADPLQEYRRINTIGTLNLAQQAADAGVKRFIFMSSIKVNGEFTEPRKLFLPIRSEVPTDPYGLSKYEAEVGIDRICRNSRMEFVIIRPPLIYGPGVKANFASMLRLTSIGVPLPLGSIKDNRRSLVFIGNLMSLINTCMEHPEAANEIFLVSDDEDLSTSEILCKLLKAFRHRRVLIPVPVSLIRIGCKLLGKEDMFQRLCGSLQLDVSKNKELLGWTPEYNVDQAFSITASAYLKNR